MFFTNRRYILSNGAKQVLPVYSRQTLCRIAVAVMRPSRYNFADSQRRTQLDPESEGKRDAHEFNDFRPIRRRSGEGPGIL